MKLDRITSDPARMSGQPCVRDLRLTVRRVVELVATYPDRAELRREFPELEGEDFRQALRLPPRYWRTGSSNSLLRHLAQQPQQRVGDGP